MREHATSIAFRRLKPGSSPLARGTHGLIHKEGSAGRLIPAHAGNIYAPSSFSPSAPAHPHSRGEHPFQTQRRDSGGGSSSLTRGTPLRPSGESGVGGLIPTHAGNTLKSTHCMALTRAHPCSRGEHVLAETRGEGGYGSSPLARGTCHSVRPSRCSPRLIPARAGNTFTSSRLTGIIPAHPRSRGEHVAPRPDGYVNPGSSPLTRGTPALLTDHDVSRGLIPTHAGTIRVTRQTEARTPAHPRSCGEHPVHQYPGGSSWGSSPLARGA